MGRGGGGLGGRRGRESKSRRVDESVERKDRDAKASRATPSAERGPSLRAVGSAERGQRLNRSQKLLDSTSGACTAVGPCAMRRHTHTHTRTALQHRDVFVTYHGRNFASCFSLRFPAPFFPSSVNVLLTPVFGGVRADVLCGSWPLGETDSSTVVLG